MQAMTKQFRLAARPDGLPQDSDFTFDEVPLGEPGDGQVLVRVLYLSIDPTNRIWMSDRDQYMPPVELGEVMRGLGVGRVVASRNPGFREGDVVSGLLGWQEHALLGAEQAAGVTVAPPGFPLPLPALLGVCGLTGVTAYVGLHDIAQARAGETVVVSAAAGAVGSIAGQLAGIAGCRAVGIAGGAEKCALVTGEFGFDAAVDYKADGWREALAGAAPDGVDVDFENVGGEVMQAVLSRMNWFGRVALCGMISAYNREGGAADDFSPILMRRLQVRGFIATDHAARWAEAVGVLAGLVTEGKLRYRETVVDGFENAPAALRRLFDGSTTGKLVVRVDPAA